MAELPRSSSILNSWLYLAIRSERERLPVLICPALVATARSAMKESSVSPERCEMTAVILCVLASSIASRVSVSVPIWLTLIKIEFAAPSSMPRWRNFDVGHKKIVADELHACRRPSASDFFQPSQSFSAIPSSIEMIGYLPHQSVQYAAISSLESSRLSLFLKMYLPSLIKLARCRVERQHHIFSGLVTGLVDRFENSFDRFFVRFQVRRKAAFVTDRGRIAALFQDRFQIDEKSPRPCAALR